MAPFWRVIEIHDYFVVIIHRQWRKLKVECHTKCRTIFRVGTQKDIRIQNGVHFARLGGN